jgi:integrase
MRAIYHKERKRWRIIVPPALTGTGRRCVYYFENKQAAEAEIRKILTYGTAKQAPVTETQHAALVMAKSLGIDEHQFLDAMKHYQKTVLAVKKSGATIYEAAVEFKKEVEREKNVRTLYKYRSTLRRLTELVGLETPMVELTREQIDIYLDSFGPGTTRRAQYANVKRFINWSLEKGYLAVDPMANSKPKDKWASNNEPLGVEEFRRILFVVAGLEPAAAGEAPTNRYFRLLPYYVLGGLCGMRRAEIISSYASDPVIEWRDINWDRNWIHIRHEVAKQTGAQDQSRYIPLEPAAAEWLRMIPVRTTEIMEISQSTLQRLNHELLHKLKIEVPDNGLRNGYASWSATFKPSSELASAMGDLESTVRRYYIKRREPESGRAWFAIRPTSGRKVVPMVA